MSSYSTASNLNIVHVLSHVEAAFYIKKYVMDDSVTGISGNDALISSLSVQTETEMVLFVGVSGYISVS